MEQQRQQRIEELLIGLGRGDSDAVSQLYSEVSTAVYGYALSFLKEPEDAKDVLHDTFISLYRSAIGYLPEGKPMAYILTIARNLCMMKLRSTSRFASESSEELLISLADERGLSTEDRMLLEYCLNVLGEEERQIVTLHALSGFKHREIAEFMGMPLPSVISKYNRAMKKMQMLVKES